MSKSRYWLNPDTLSFEPLKVTLRERIKHVAWFLAISTVVSVSGIFFYTNNFDTPKTMSMRRSNAETVSQLELLQKQFQATNEYLTQLELRDNNVYRSIFGMEKIPASLREQGFGGADRYAAFSPSKYADVLTSSAKSLDKLMKKVYILSVSFDSVIVMSSNISEMSKCVPAIQPVSFSDRVRVGANFGWRMDPFYKDLRHHDGIDIGGIIGEPIFVTGNGKVVEVETGKGWGPALGYGNKVVVDHGFGYKTCYAHLNTVEVVMGQRLTRGQKIGTLGHTGKSTSPHLHYEVRYLGNPVNPINYFANDMSEKEYEQMLHFSQQTFGSEN